MNKPVAWMTKWGDGNWSFQTEPREDEVCIPLYTHPHPDNLGLAESIIKQQQLKIDNLLENNARLDNEIEVLTSHPVKELTDEEILKMAADRFHYSEYRLVLEFARAILRKAQEK